LMALISSGDTTTAESGTVVCPASAASHHIAVEGLAVDRGSSIV
jgi:hypothetical protein